MTSKELARLAAAEGMIPKAPVKARRSVEIAAPVERVWEILTDVSQWAAWYPYLKNACLKGSFEAGTGLVYGGLFKHRLHLAKITERRLVMIYGTFLGFTAVTRWELENLSGTRSGFPLRSHQTGSSSAPSTVTTLLENICRLG